MKRSNSAASHLLFKSKLDRPTSIQKITHPTVSMTTKENQPNNCNRDYEIIKVKSSNRLIIRYPSLTSIDEKKKIAQPHRRLIKAKISTQQQITSNKQIPKLLFKRKRSFFPQSQKQIPIEDIKPLGKRNNQTLKQSKVERKLIVRNPFQKRQLEIELQHLSKCDQSEIAHKSQINQDISEINNLVKTINEHEVN